MSHTFLTCIFLKKTFKGEENVDELLKRLELFSYLESRYEKIKK
jgi:hypothetical protein